MQFLKIIAVAAEGYLFGSIMFAVILTKLRFGRDVRQEGSGNAGATNVARVFGLGSGLLTFACDLAKTVCAMHLGRLIAGDTGFLVAAAFCLAGHCFPVFFGFRGGKGVTVGAAIGLVIDWRIFVLLLTVFFVMFLITRRVSPCSITAAATFPLFELLLGYNDTAYILLGVFTAGVVWVMHRDNIRRLISGEESRFVPGHEKKKK